MSFTSEQLAAMSYGLYLLADKVRTEAEASLQRLHVEASAQPLVPYLARLDEAIDLLRQEGERDGPLLAQVLDDQRLEARCKADATLEQLRRQLAKSSLSAYAECIAAAQHLLAQEEANLFAAFDLVMLQQEAGALFKATLKAIKAPKSSTSKLRLC